MSVAPAAVETSQGSERVRSRAVAVAPWLVVCCYLLGALALTWRLWADPASRAQVGDVRDVDLFAWFLRYAATAVAHGHLPALVTAAMNAPRGINMMGNTSFLLPGMLLTPVTLLAGPQVSLAIVLTLGFAGSAASLFWVLRRWGGSLAAAALGGAVYGCSPALLDSGLGHYNLQFAVLPPLIIDAPLRIVTGRGHPVRAGVWLGLLSAAQLFTGEELLAQTAIVGLVLVITLAASHPRAVRARARDAALGLAVGAGIALLICGRALWAQLRGPLSAHGSWEALSDYSSHLGAFVTPPGDLLFHTHASAAAAVASGGHSYLAEYLAYLGWPLLVVLVAAAVRFWRDPRVRAAAVTWAVLEVLSLGAESRTPLPGGAPALALAAGPAHPRRDSAGPVRHPRRRRGRRRARLLAGPGALGGAGGRGLAAKKPAVRGRGPGAAAPDSAALPGQRGPAGPGWLAGGLRRAAAGAGRPRARRPRAVLGFP